MAEALKILLLEDSVADGELVARELTHAGLRHDIRRVATRDDFLRGLAEYQPDVILSDHTLPGYDGLSALRESRERTPGTPFVFVSGTLGETRAVESLKHGASDYVVKGDLGRLPSAIERAIEEKRLRRERELLEQRLRYSESLFKSLAEQAPIGIVLFDQEAKATFVNDYWCWIAARSRDEIFGFNGLDDWAQVLHPDDRERVVAELTNLFRDRRPLSCECRYVRPSSEEIRWVTVRAVSQRDSRGEHIGFISLISDNTEQALAEQKIVRMNRIQAVLSGINSAIVRVSNREKLCDDVCHIAVAKGNFRFAWIALVDPASRELRYAKSLGEDSALLEAIRSYRARSLSDLGPTAVETYTTRRPVIVDAIGLPFLESRLADLIQRAGIQSMAHLPLLLGDNISGVLTLFADSADFFNDDEMRLLDELAADIAFALDHIDKQERLNYLAYYDSLTELPNRTLFYEHLRQHLSDARRESRQVMLLAIDVERFRHINESFGERFGDALLKMAATRMMRYVGSTGRLGRLGGDSFGAVVPIRQDIDATAHEIERAIDDWARTPFKVLGKEIIAPLRAGIATFPRDAGDAETLFLNASAALKKAKTANEHLLFYAEEDNARVSAQLHLETRLRRAVEREEFVLYYQPKLHLETGCIGGMEALIRWRDPERGLVPPGQFIPLLEETGLIYDVGLWALQRAFDDHARLRERLPHAPYIAVNVSAQQLQRKTFFDDMLGVTGRAASGHHGIDLEITESLIMRHIEDNIPKLKAVRDRDIHIAIDDFGTGYSSLAYIARLPIDVLKIDGSFIAKLADGGESRAIVSAIITLAHSLKLRVVAECVETEEQARMLRELGCDEAQGYLFCRPLPFEELVERLAADDGNVVLAQ